MLFEEDKSYSSQSDLKSDEEEESIEVGESSVNQDQDVNSLAPDIYENRVEYIQNL